MIASISAGTAISLALMSVAAGALVAGALSLRASRRNERAAADEVNHLATEFRDIAQRLGLHEWRERLAWAETRLFEVIQSVTAALDDIQVSAVPDPDQSDLRGYSFNQVGEVIGDLESALAQVDHEMSEGRLNDLVARAEQTPVAALVLAPAGAEVIIGSIEVIDALAAVSDAVARSRMRLRSVPIRPTIADVLQETRRVVDSVVSARRTIDRHIREVMDARWKE